MVYGAGGKKSHFFAKNWLKSRASSFLIGAGGRSDREPRGGGIGSHQGVVVADKSRRTLGWEDRRFEDEAIPPRITQRIDGFHMDAAASLATRQPQQSRVGYVPITV